MYSQIFINQKEKNNNIIDLEFSNLDKLLKENELNRAKYKLFGIKKMTQNNKNHLNYLKYYSQVLKEKESIDENVNNYLSNGLSIIESNTENKYDKALIIFYNGLNNTKHNIFNYYIAKVFYKLKDYERASKFFKGYLYEGGEYTISSCIYMAKILEKCVKHKNYREAKKYLNNAKKICEYSLNNKEQEELDIKINRLIKKGEKNEKRFK